MSDGGRYEAQAEWLRGQREAGDHSRLRVGMRVARLMRESSYGEGIVPSLAIDTGYTRATLYEYAGVARFLVRWRGLSARQIFSDFPMLTYSHLRRAMRYTDLEDAIEALIHANDNGLTAGSFGVYVSEELGKTVPDPPLVEFQGWQNEINEAWRRNAHKWAGKRVKVTIRELR